MSNPQGEILIDAELLAEVLDEALENLEATGALFIQLEAEPNNISVLQAIQRPVHTLKGNSSFFGLFKVKTLAHDLESIIHRVVKRELLISPAVTSILLEGVDSLKQILRRVRRGESEIEDEATYQELLRRVQSTAVGKREATLSSELQTIYQYMSDLHEQYGTFGEGLGESLTMVLSILQNLIDRQGQLQNQALLEKTGVLAPSSTSTPKPESVVSEESQGEIDREDHAKVKGAALPAEGQEAEKTMRISEKKIDTFLAFVGELIIVGDMFRHLQDKLVDVNNVNLVLGDFERATETFNVLAENLRKTIMGIRKVSVQRVLHKIPRLVRDVAMQSAKDIRVELDGWEVQVDKSLIELFDDISVHLARNAADHGIETPSVREQVGKPKQGTIRAIFSEEEDTLVLTIEDDGAGLNYDAIRRKGEELGMIQPGQSLTEDDVINLIFCSGVSTAKKITDISGRGVGLDVVKQAIISAGGQIKVSSQSGRGTRFEVQLPKAVTTEIIRGFLVKSGGQCYVLPLASVQESFAYDDTEVGSVLERANYIKRHGEVLPVLHLEKILWPKNYDKIQTNQQPIVIILSNGLHRFGLTVDDVLGVHQVVVRDVGGGIEESKLIKGATVMGDGTIAFILDPQGIEEEVHFRV